MHRIIFFLEVLLYFVVSSVCFEDSPITQVADSELSTRTTFSHLDSITVRKLKNQLNDNPWDFDKLLRQRPDDLLALDAKLKKESFIPGSLDQAIVQRMVSQFAHLKEISYYFDDLSWFASTAEFFKFHGAGNITLQGYYIPSPRIDANNFTIHDQDGYADLKELPAILFCAGWTESTLKYITLLRLLHGLQYPIYSFDFRGQGFSEQTGYDKGRVTHTENFSASYIADMEIFIKTKIYPPSCAIKPRREIIFVANSLAGLVGLTYSAKNPGVFSHMILSCPCIKPTLSLPVRAAIIVLRKIGLGSMLPTRLSQNISDLKLTHSLGNHLVWQQMRAIAPHQLQIEGPSVAHLHEVIEASDNLLYLAKSITSSVLIFQASDDIFVENDAMAAFVPMLEQSPQVNLIRIKNTYHEMFVETEEVMDRILGEVKLFLEVF